MASNGLQAGQGDAPAFPNSDAPDLGGDSEELARYARKRGNALVGSTTERSAYSQAREGELWGNVTTDELTMHTGSGWERVFRRAGTYTPTWSAFTPGSSAVAVWYQIVGKLCVGTVDVTLATGWSMGSGVTMSLPVTPANAQEGRPCGEAIYVDSGTGYFKGRLMMAGTGVAKLMWEPNAAFLSDVKAAEPFTWVAGDVIRVQFSYEVAAA